MNPKDRSVKQWRGVTGASPASSTTICHANAKLASAVQAAPIFIATYVASMFFPALDSIVKEKAFGDAKEKLGGKQLDIFVVNSYSSGFQAQPLHRPHNGCMLSMLGILRCRYRSSIVMKLGDAAWRNMSHAVVMSTAWSAARIACILLVDGLGP